MASIVDRLAKLARGPQGQKLINQAKEQASKPENRQKVEQLKQRLRRR